LPVAPESVTSPAVPTVAEPRVAAGKPPSVTCPFAV
jgi:hypothetical protein